MMNNWSIHKATSEGTLEVQGIERLQMIRLPSIVRRNFSSRTVLGI